MMSIKWWRDCDDVRRLRNGMEMAMKALEEKQKHIDALENDLRIYRDGIERMSRKIDVVIEEM